MCQSSSVNAVREGRTWAGFSFFLGQVKRVILAFSGQRIKGKWTPTNKEGITCRL
jgi:hypothetical protein